MLSGGVSRGTAVASARTRCDARAGYLPNEQDLNQGAGGDYIFTCNLAN